MWLLGLICKIRNAHRFQLPPGPADTTLVDIDALCCLVCSKPMLEVVAKLQGVSKEQVRLYFTSPILNPPGVPKSAVIKTGYELEDR